MNEKRTAEGTTTAVLRRLQTQVLPKILALQERLARGEKVTTEDLRYLRQGLSETMHAKALFDYNPEFKEISAKIIALYRDISAQALRNEDASVT